MTKLDYKITNKAKFLIIQFLICTLGILSGFTYDIYKETRKWDSIIYPGVKIDNITLGGLNENEALTKINSEYIPLSKSKKINITFNNELFSIQSSNLIDDFYINTTILDSLNFGKDLNVLEKYLLISKEKSHEINIPLSLNENNLIKFVDTLATQLNKPASDARLTISSDGNLHIIEELDGYELNKEKLKSDIVDKLLYAPSEDIYIDAPIEVIKPSISSEKLISIDNIVSSFTTDFSTSSTERSHNIELAADFINGKILFPDEIFSFNDVVGNRTKARGFMDAPVIVGNKVESGVGGGICQVTSTLYNALLYCGITPLERINHTLPTSYVKLGTDATVSWDSIDFKFKNTLGYPIYIQTLTNNKQLSVNIYSNSKLLEKQYIIENNIYEKINPSIEYINDSFLDLGKSYTVQKGTQGFKVKVLRYTYEGTKLINTETISNNYYEPTTTILKVGTGSTIIK